MNNYDDIIADTSLYFRQIIALTDLMLANSNVEDTPNLMTLKELAESGLNKLNLINKSYFKFKSGKLLIKSSIPNEFCFGLVSVELVVSEDFC